MTAADRFVQATLNGVAMGWIYVLIALGLSLIFGIMRTVQFAHGEIYMLGAYLSYYLVLCHVPFLVAIAISMVTLAACGYVIEAVFFRRLRGRPELSVVFSLGLLLILQTASVMLFGLAERSLPRLSDASVQVGGVRLPTERLIAVVISIVAVGAALFFLKKTRYGLAVVACAQNRDGAVLQGIDPDRMANVVMMMGCSLAALGGSVAGSLLKLSPFMGGEVLSKGLVIIVLGGMGSLVGTIASGLLLAVSDNLVPVYFGSAASTMVPLVVVIAVLVVRPHGLFGHA